MAIGWYIAYYLLKNKQKFPAISGSGLSRTAVVGAFLIVGTAGILLLVPSASCTTSSSPTASW